ncbi:MBL fold metallo-hydrolase [Simiduia curdlanivorans]|uniref:MBL fold metallo-hydrolase RNA specificity domain-containing protein n=1 Tax=Simiduia curdlanivorans TaxID=1492769 RepID=A0ABV8V3X1_9GAMM|nr:MBL fold metallo-hydrolase [Simiduia curdlanivorans]MDN3639971.1 MBL fold metallo-hydrolase [Simiduia curdlanivorans]
MKPIHHGAKTGVTGSCHELFVSPHESLLVDCGMFQGAEASERDLDPADPPEIDGGALSLGFDLHAVKVLIVTHCHIDHVGRIPAIIAAGFRGPIYCTEATAILLPEVIEDALKIGVTRNRKIIEQFLLQLKSQLVPIAYNRWCYLEYFSAPVRLRFQRAGHILGSAYVELDVPRPTLEPWVAIAPDLGASEGRARIVFSGDLGAPHTPLLPEPIPPKFVDVMVIESTYGDKLHEGRDQRQRNLKDILQRSLRNGGTTLIPAFSIGRTQELLYEIEDIMHSMAQAAPRSASLWERLPIIIDSPMAAKFTRHYDRLKGLWDKEAQGRLAVGRDPLDFANRVIIDSHDQHMSLVNRLVQTGEAAIVIAASGMCSGGRIMNYLKALLPDERTDIVFVGYQARGTPGRAIQQYGQGGYVYLDNEKMTIGAQVHTLSGYSAHADQRNLLDFIAGCEQGPNYVRVVHGDIAVQREFVALVKERIGCEVEAAAGK